MMDRGRETGWERVRHRQGIRKRNGRETDPVSVSCSTLKAGMGSTTGGRTIVDVYMCDGEK